MSAAFAATLKTIRIACGQSQNKLAARAGYDHSYVSRLEGDQREPTREAVNRLADALALDPTARDRLMVAAGFLPVRKTALLSDEPVLADLLDLLSDDTIPHDSRANVRAMLRLLADQLRVQQAAYQEAA